MIPGGHMRAGMDSDSQEVKGGSVEENEDFRNPSFYRPGSGNILNFFAQALEPASAKAAEESDRRAEAVGQEVHAAAADCPQSVQLARALAQHDAPPTDQSARDDHVDSSAAPEAPCDFAPSHTHTTGDGSAAEVRQQDLGDEAVPSRPFVFGAAKTRPAVRRKPLGTSHQHQQQQPRQRRSLVETNGQKALRQQLDEFKHKKRPLEQSSSSSVTAGNRRPLRPINSRRSSTSNISINQSMINRPRRSPKLWGRRRSSVHASAAVIPVINDHASSADKENDVNTTKPHANSKSSLFPLQFSPPAKPPPVTCVMTVNPGAPPPPPAKGSMFCMQFSPPAKTKKRVRLEARGPVTSGWYQQNVCVDARSPHIVSGRSHAATDAPEGPEPEPREEMGHEHGSVVGSLDEGEHEQQQQTEAQLGGDWRPSPTVHEAEIDPAAQADEADIPRMSTPTEDLVDEAADAADCGRKGDGVLSAARKLAFAIEGDEDHERHGEDESKKRLLVALDDLIAAERERALLGEIVREADMAAANWEERCRRVSEQADGLMRSLEETQAQVKEKDAHVSDMQNQLVEALSRISLLEAKSSQAAAAPQHDDKRELEQHFKAAQDRLLSIEDKVAQSQVRVLESQTQAGAERCRLKAEAESERELRVALQDCLNIALRAAGLKSISSTRDLGASREEREAALRERAEKLTTVIEGAEADARKRMQEADCLKKQLDEARVAEHAAKDAKAELGRRLDQIQDQHKTELCAIRAEHKKQLDEARAAERTATYEKAELGRMLDQIQDQHITELCAIRAEHKKQLDEARAAERTATYEKAELGRMLDQIQDQHITELCAIRAEHRKQLDEARAAERAAEDTKAELGRMLDQIQDQHKTELCAIRAEHKKQLDEARAAERTATCEKAELGRMLDRLQNQHKSEYLAVRAELEATERQKQRADLRVKSLEDDMDRLEKARAKLEDQQRATAADLKVSVAEKGLLEERILSLETEVTALENDAQRREGNTLKELELLRRNNKIFKDECEALRVELDAARHDTERFKRQLESQSADLGAAKEELERRRESARAMEDQRERMTRTMQQLDAELKEERKLRAEERERREAVEHHLMKQTAEIDCFKDERSDLATKVLEYRERLRLMEHESKDMLRRLEHLAEECERGYLVRRTLHNQVMELRGNIRVFVRVRPPLAGEPAGMPFVFVDPGIGSLTNSQGGTDCTCIEVHEPQTNRGGLSEKRRRWRFNYDKVFDPRAMQEAVFADIQPLVQSALDGYRVCIFAYGMTGSGKTFTVAGPDGNPAGPTRGVIYRAVDYIFDTVAALNKQKWTHRLHVEMVEIYNETLRDLLVDVADAGPSKGRQLEVRHVSYNATNDCAGEMPIPGLRSVEVQHAAEVTALVARAFSRRCTRSTRMNTDSSRSHCLFTLRFEGTSPSGQMRRGCLNMCDLAGSERLDKSGSAEDPELLKEAQAINTSLSVLGNVMSALYRGDPHVPYRESVLTNVLRPSLSGESAKALMLCTLSPSTAHLNESMCSLRFARKVNGCVVKGSTGQGGGGHHV